MADDAIVSCLQIEVLMSLLLSCSEIISCVAYRSSCLFVFCTINLEPWSIAEYFVIFNYCRKYVLHSLLHRLRDKVEESRGGLFFISHDIEEFKCFL